MAEMKDKMDIRDPANPSRKVSMPIKDFDPNKHEKWSEQDEADLQMREAANDPNHEPVPGPPMQDFLVAASPESLPEQPNAAVIEAPGSRAAELIQRARGDVPIDMAGPRQDRAEQETRRAEDVMRTMYLSPKQTEEDRELRRREYASSQSAHEDDEKRIEDKVEDVKRAADRRSAQPEKPRTEVDHK